MKLPALRNFLPSAALLLFMPMLPAQPFWDRNLSKRAGSGQAAFEEADGPAGIVLEAMEKLTPGLADPPVMFSIREGNRQADLFSPVDGGALETLSAWQIQVFDQSGRKISFIQGRRNPVSAGIPWAGTSSGGDPLPDGVYNARFVWQDSAKQAHATRKISVSLFTPPEIRNLSDRKLLFDYTEEGLVISIAESMIFRSGQSRILNRAVPALREISLFLGADSGNRAIIRGYTDSRGSTRKNISLSRERAAQVYQYLVAAGIDPARLAYEGLGSARPVAPNMTEAGRARNRRVEVVVLKTAG